MIPLITYTPRLTLVAASRALLIAETAKPQYFPVLLGAQLPEHWPPPEYDAEVQQHFLEQLTAGGREAAGWYGWYALLRAGAEVAANTLVGTAGFHGPPVDETAEIGFAVVTDWQGKGLGTELVAGLVRHAADTDMVRYLTARINPANAPARRVLETSGFQQISEAPDTEGRHLFGRNVTAADKNEKRA
ncbi:GNAT family N-acetyltransferase [Hymenobacter psychrophilus]|uniref:Protein N-acetyltransferase, RimJ/RimL family n=1 Tax=Hymenobacter psychrophilus TaxID=651662 RepID=A0A1H3I363_9BACT|nr:GNAT family N-acetyltransferase [Hymenobacter psychrophilus]SDY22156.1 Protein N-acetyltransferase, RimJ/RimL family [Hymenobacter psychrophilus]